MSNRGSPRVLRAEELRRGQTYVAVGEHATVGKFQKTVRYLGTKDGVLSLAFVRNPAKGLRVVAGREPGSFDISKPSGGGELQIVDPGRSNSSPTVSQTQHNKTNKNKEVVKRIFVPGIPRNSRNSKNSKNSKIDPSTLYRLILNPGCRVGIAAATRRQLHAGIAHAAFDDLLQRAREEGCLSSRNTPAEPISALTSQSQKAKSRKQNSNLYSNLYSRSLKPRCSVGLSADARRRMHAGLSPPNPTAFTRSLQQHPGCR